LQFGNRVLSRMIINGAEETRKELHVAHVEDVGLSMDDMKFDDFSDLSSDDQHSAMLAKEYQEDEKQSVQQIPTNNIFIAIIIILLSGIFWYGVGRLGAFLF